GETSRFMLVLPALIGAIVGWDIRWSLLDFLAFAMGTREGGAELGIGSFGRLPITLMAIATALFLIGTLRLFLARQAAALLGAVGVFAVMGGYYAFVAVNPWTGRIGQTWSLYKTVQWGFPLLLAVQVAGLWTLTQRWRRAVLIGLAIIAVVLAFPAQRRLALM